MSDKAILIPANPKKIDIYGNILAHAMHLARYVEFSGEWGNVEKKNQKNFIIKK